VAHLTEFLRSHAVGLPTLAKVRSRNGPVGAGLEIDLALFRQARKVLVLMLTTSILGPVLTERFTPRMLPDLRPAQAA
jgi:hypothetical protein